MVDNNPRPMKLQLKDVVNYVPEYDGQNISATEYIKKLRQMKKLIDDGDERNLINLLILKMTGEAGEALGDSNMHTIEELITAVKALYPIQDDIHELYSKVCKIIQEDDETVLQYTNRLRKLVLEIKEIKETDSSSNNERTRFNTTLDTDAVKSYKKGLKSEIKYELEGETTLQAMSEKAIEIENDIARRRSMKTGATHNRYADHQKRLEEPKKIITCQICRDYQHEALFCRIAACVYCNATDHYSNNCQNETNKIRLICRFCSQRGHSISACPLNKRRNIHCQYCQDLGHEVDQCPDIREYIKCWKCGETGHEPKVCRNRATTKSRKCQLCEDTSHTIQECPDLRCQKCNKNGHSAKFCTTDRGREPHRVCSMCEESGHDERDCIQVKICIAEQKAKQKYTCQICDQSEHTAKFCPILKGTQQMQPNPNSYNNSYSSNYNQGFRKKFCTYCKNVGHIIDGCQKYQALKNLAQENTHPECNYSRRHLEKERNKIAFPTQTYTQLHHKRKNIQDESNNTNTKDYDEKKREHQEYLKLNNQNKKPESTILNQNITISLDQENIMKMKSKITQKQKCFLTKILQEISHENIKENDLIKFNNENENLSSSNSHISPCLALMSSEVKEVNKKSSIENISESLNRINVSESLIDIESHDDAVSNSINVPELINALGNNPLHSGNLVRHVEETFLDEIYSVVCYIRLEHLDYQNCSISVEENRSIAEPIEITIFQATEIYRCNDFTFKNFSDNYNLNRHTNLEVSENRNSHTENLDVQIRPESSSINLREIVIGKNKLKNINESYHKKYIINSTSTKKSKSKLKHNTTKKILMTNDDKLKYLNKQKIERKIKRKRKRKPNAKNKNENYNYIITKSNQIIEQKNEKSIHRKSSIQILNNIVKPKNGFVKYPTEYFEFSNLNSTKLPSYKSSSFSNITKTFTVKRMHRITKKHVLINIFDNETVLIINKNIDYSTNYIFFKHNFSPHINIFLILGNTMVQLFLLIILITSTFPKANAEIASRSASIKYLCHDARKDNSNLANGTRKSIQNNCIGDSEKYIDKYYIL